MNSEGGTFTDKETSMTWPSAQLVHSLAARVSNNQKAKAYGLNYAFTVTINNIKNTESTNDNLHTICYNKCELDFGIRKEITAILPSGNSS